MSFTVFVATVSGVDSRVSSFHETANQIVPSFHETHET